MGTLRAGPFAVAGWYAAGGDAVVCGVGPAVCDVLVVEDVGILGGLSGEPQAEMTRMVMSVVAIPALGNRHLAGRAGWLE